MGWGCFYKECYDPLMQAKAYADANPLFKKVQLKAGDDLNNIVKTGIYYNSSDLNETQLKNAPIYLSSTYALLGTLVVYSVYDVKTGGVYQAYYPHTGNYYYSRITNTSGVLGAWEKSVTRSEVDNAIVFP